jgi:preprotein translocase subunit SecF
MELFKNPDYDFLSRKWPFIIGSLVLIAAGVASLVIHNGPRYGIDFEGGAMMSLKFTNQPPLDEIRSALTDRIAGEVSVQEVLGSGEVIVSTELQSDAQLAETRSVMLDTLYAGFGGGSDSVDFNNAGADLIASTLRPALQRRGVPLSDLEIDELAERLRVFRDTAPHSGLIASFDELSSVEGVTPDVLAALKETFSLAPFSIRSFESVGPKIGEELRHQAMMVTLLALGGMLVYIAFRFEWIYGVAAVIAVFHDVIITIGLFSLTDKEISLTVIAALLTLVGYSMNDSIVVFDRIRENLKVVRRGEFTSLVNLSINQCLNRTVLTSGLTFLAVLSLFLFGGQVLNGFAFALVAGILVGTYSSVFIASPILVSLQGALESRKKARVIAGTGRAGKAATRKGSAKAAR